MTINISKMKLKLNNQLCSIKEPSPLQLFAAGCIIVFIVLGYKSCYGHRSEVRSMLSQSCPALKGWNNWTLAEYIEIKKTRWRKRDIHASGIIKSDAPLFISVKHSSAKEPLPELFVFEEFNDLKQGIGFYAEIYKGYSRQNLVRWSTELPVFFTQSQLKELEKTAVVMINNELQKASLENMAFFEKYLKEQEAKLPELLNTSKKTLSAFLKDAMTYKNIKIFNLDTQERETFLNSYSQKISDMNQTISEINTDLTVIQDCLRFPLNAIYGSDKYTDLLKERQLQIQGLRDKMKMQYDNFKTIHVSNIKKHHDIQSGRERIIKPKTANF